MEQTLPSVVPATSQPVCHCLSAGSQLHAYHLSVHRWHPGAQTPPLPILGLSPSPRGFLWHTPNRQILWE